MPITVTRVFCLLSVSLLACLAIRIPVQSESSGATSGGCGDPASGGVTCTNCHKESDAVLPASQGGVYLTFNGDTITEYEPGRTYNGIAYINEPQTTTFGFETACQTPDGTSQGKLKLGSGSKTILSGKYLTHSAARNTNPSTWFFNWVAPTTGTGTVTFYTCFSAKDVHIYSTTTVLKEKQFATGITVPNSLTNLKVLPIQPGQVSVQTELSQSAQIVCHVVDMQGHLCDTKTWKSNPGNQLWIVDLPSSPGVYVLWLSVGGSSQVVKVPVF